MIIDDSKDHVDLGIKTSKEAATVIRAAIIGTSKEAATAIRAANVIARLSSFADSKEDTVGSATQAKSYPFSESIPETPE